MAGAQRSGARWIALLLGLALVASAAVAYALIRVTTPSDGDQQAVQSAQGSVPASVTVSPADATVRSTVTADTTTTEVAPMSTTSPAPPSPSAAPDTASSPTTPTMPSPSPLSTATVSGSAAPSTVTSMLAGSDITLPAAWSGTAKITVTVLGSCAGGNSSVYTDTPADLALDLPQNEASAVAPTVTSTLPDNEPTLTLGVNAGTVPSLTVFSSAVDKTGTFQRYWQLRLTPEADRTEIRGTLSDQPADGDNPNQMNDAETSLQPCETAGTVGLPRVLAPGSTLSGWVSQTSAKLTLRATTTDGKRRVLVQMTATRQQ